MERFFHDLPRLSIFCRIFFVVWKKNQDFHKFLEFLPCFVRNPLENSKRVISMDKRSFSTFLQRVCNVLPRFFHIFKITSDFQIFKVQCFCHVVSRSFSKKWPKKVPRFPRIRGSFPQIRSHLVRFFNVLPACLPACFFHGMMDCQGAQGQNARRTKEK